MHTSRMHPSLRITRADSNVSSQLSTPRAASASPSGSAPAALANVPPVPDSLESVIKRVNLIRKHSKLISIIPRSIRATVAEELIDVLHAVCTSNDLPAWSAFYCFTTSVLSIPIEKVRGRTLTSLIRENLNRFHREKDLPPRPTLNARSRPSVATSRESSTARLVQLKLSQGDVSAAARTLLSTDVTAPSDDATRQILMSKHPDMPPSASYPPDPRPPASVDEIRLTESEIRAAVLSFSNSSSGGPDGICPRHLKDLIQKNNDFCPLIGVLTRFCSLLLNGRVPDFALETSYGANLLALRTEASDRLPLGILCCSASSRWEGSGSQI